MFSLFIAEVNSPKKKATKCEYFHINLFLREAWWPSGRASDSDEVGGSILTQVAMLCP